MRPGWARRARSSSATSVTRAGVRRPSIALLRNGSGQPPAGSPSSPFRNPITESGMSKRCGSASNCGGLRAHRHQVQGEVADHLRRRGDLRGPAEDLVGRRVHVLDGLELLPQAQRDRLLAQVGQLPAGDLVAVHAARRGGQPGLERPVHLAHRLPVRLQVQHRLRVQLGWRSVWSSAATRADIGGCDVVEPSPSWPRRPRRRRRRWPPSAWRAGRRWCRGCAGGRAGRTGHAAR